MSGSDEKRHYFETFGPFSIKPENGRCVRPPDSWWAQINEEYYEENLSGAVGCYMFCMGSENITPWYIGKTVNKRGFREEVFTAHKLKHYNDVIEAGYRGPPSMYLFPLITRGFHEPWRLAKGSTHDKVISWLERTLIGMAYAQNNELRNLKDATFLKTVDVRGIIGSPVRGRPHGDISKAQQALLGKDRN